MSSHFTRHGNGSSNGAKNNGYVGGSNGTNIPRNRNDRKDVFMGNMPFNVDVEDVKDFLKSHKIDPEEDVEIRIALDKDTGKQKGFTFISCYDASKHAAILKLDKCKFQDRPLRINDANDKPNR